MGSKIPETIRENVVKQWLSGLSRDEIAKTNTIGAGTVSLIIKECKKEGKKYSNDETQFQLLRELAVVLKKEGMNINLFAASVRLQKKFEKMGLKEEHIESFLENIHVNCFRLGRKEEEFINLVNRIAVYSRRCGIPIEMLPVHIMDSERQLTRLKLEVQNIRKRRDQAMIEQNITLEQLEEYKRDKPLICQIDELRDRIKSLTRMNAELDHDLAKEQFNRYMEKRNWALPEEDLTIIATQYPPFQSIDKKSQAKEIFDIAKAFINHPAQYVDVIVSIKERKLLSEQSLKNVKIQAK